MVGGSRGPGPLWLGVRGTWAPVVGGQGNLGPCVWLLGQGTSPVAVLVADGDGGKLHFRFRDALDVHVGFAEEEVVCPASHLVEKQPQGDEEHHRPQQPGTRSSGSETRGLNPLGGTKQPKSCWKKDKTGSDTVDEMKLGSEGRY